MKYLALIEKINSIVEEEITIKIENIVLIGFANICPYKIEEGKKYMVSLGLTILDDFILLEQEDKEKKIIRIDDSFEYELRGFLTTEGLFDTKIIFEDDNFKEYEYMYGKYVKIKVDRINIEFLENKIE